jgi:hypothetical protein
LIKVPSQQTGTHNETPAVSSETAGVFIAAFDKAAACLAGASYEPVAVLGKQVVAGMNYCLLCKVTATVPDAKPQ